MSAPDVPASPDPDDVRDRVRERFGARSNNYRTSAVHATGEDLDMLVKLVGAAAGARALDIATGAGHTALALAQAGADVVASDITPAMLAETVDNAKSHGLTVETALADAASLPFADASFDIVTARMAPHHFPDPEGFVREVARVLRPGGRFGLEDQVAPDDPAAAAVINEFEAVRDPSHNVQLPVARWEAIARDAGLTVVSAPVFSKWVEFDWWTSIQNVSAANQTRISQLLANAPQSALDWYTPEFRADGLVQRFRSPHVIMLAMKPEQSATPRLRGGGRRTGVRPVCHNGTRASHERTRRAHGHFRSWTGDRDMSTPRFGRMITAMVTPFRADLELDLPRAQELALKLIDDGSDALVVCGTTGESPTVFYPQKIALFKAVIEAVGGRVPIIANAGDNCTADSIDFAREVQALGVDAIMAVVPYYNKPPQEGLYRHFRAIAESVDLPVVMYNIPGRSVVNLTAETALRLAHDVENIVAVKEASGNFSQIGEIAHGAPDGFEVLSGNDEDTLPLMALGGTGVISVISHIAGPRFKEMVVAQAAGDHTKALRIHLELLPLMKTLFMTSNPIMVKKGLELQGFPVGGLRLPLIDADEVQTAELARVMRHTGVLD